MMKYLLICLTFLIGLRCVAQELVTQGLTTKLKPGIYANYKEFINNTPSETAPFQIVPHYANLAKDTTNQDSVIRGYTLKLLDPTVKLKRVFCFFDGKKLYVNTQRGLPLERQLLFFPVEYIGRFPFIEVKSKKPITLLTFGLVSIIDREISGDRDYLLYFNKKGELFEATPQAIGFLIRKDKDFVNEYNAEKKLNNEVFRKYLLKMNQRYPL